MISSISSSTSQLTANDVSKNTDDENNKNKIKKRHSTIIKEKQGKFLSVYSIDDTGKKTLLRKIPITNTKTDDKKDSNDLFNSENPKFVAQSVINNTRASIKFNQQMHHKDDVKEMLNILKPETI